MMRGGGSIHHGSVINGNVRSRSLILQLKRFSKRRQKISRGLIFLVLLGLGRWVTIVS